MFYKVIIKNKIVLPNILLITTMLNIITNASCINNIQIDKNEIINSNNLLYENKPNSIDMSNEDNTSLCNRYNNICDQYSIDDTILSNKTDINNTLSIDYFLELLWNNYKHIFNIPHNDSQVRIISVHDNIIQQHIDEINEQYLELISKRKEFKNKKNIGNEKKKNIINSIKYKQPNSNKKLALQKFMKEEITKFSNNIKFILNIMKQHESINDRRSIIDTYFKMQSLILNTGSNTTLKINTDYNDINNKIDILNKEVLENINSFYDSCLIGHDLYNETAEDKLNIINNKISELISNQKESNNILKIINKKISELETSSNIKEITNKLQILINKISELAQNENLKHIKNDLIILNKRLSNKFGSHSNTNLVININLKNIRNNLSLKENKGKSIIPTTNNILCWCSENYEEWDEELSGYEQLIANIFKDKLSKKQITRCEFYDTFNLLYKIVNINMKIENYYRTAKLLCNLSMFKQPHPIILPSNLAV